MIRVMVVDDSALVRKIATDILSADPDIVVVATAGQAEFALQKLAREQPDVITLDIEMPGMGGLEAIRRIMGTRPTPIVVLSAHAARGAALTLQALELGAVDFVPKPTNSLSGGISSIARDLVEKVKGAAGVAVRAVSPPAPGETLPASQCASPLLPNGGGDVEYDLVAIGTSTGGPVALKTVLAQLPGTLPVGVVVVQHMPAVFTKAFAERLDHCSPLRVKEAEDEDPILPGCVLLAPGNWHMTVERSGPSPHVRLNQNETVNGHRPSVDVLMRSVAQEYGALAVGVIMTGMGTDGAAGLHDLRRRGGYIIAQDEKSSVVYGMNREVVHNGDAHEVVPVEVIAGRIQERLFTRAPARKAV